MIITIIDDTSFCNVCNKEIKGGRPHYSTEEECPCCSSECYDELCFMNEIENRREEKAWEDYFNSMKTWGL